MCVVASLLTVSNQDLCERWLFAGNIAVSICEKTPFAFEVEDTMEDICMHSYNYISFYYRLYLLLQKMNWKNYWFSLL